jgi:endonuclease-3
MKKKVRMNAETRSEMFGRLLKQIPNPTTELNYSTSFELLVAVTLSAQATDKSVNQVTDILFPLANTPESIFELGEDTLRDTIKSIGLFNSKAKHIIQTCRILIDKYSSEVPETRKELEALPGVGRKTANVVLNTAFGQPTIAVDTHIYRVANRTAIASGKTVLEVEKKLIKFIPDEFKVPAHHLMILHGRYVCKARSPHCTDCKLLDLCEYEEKNI